MKLVFAIFAALIFSALEVPLSEATYSVENIKIEEKLVPFGYSPAKNREVDVIALHSIFAPDTSEPYDVDNIISVMRRYNVSAHYLLARDGTTYRLVREENVSHHAGKSRMPDPDGRTGVNQFSIGIELINGYDDRPTEAQYVSLQALMRNICSRHSIRAVVAHGEIAGDRRSDPWNLDWQRIDKCNPPPIAESYGRGSCIRKGKYTYCMDSKRIIYLQCLRGTVGGYLPQRWGSS